ncbi:MULTISPECIES: AAA family ATPase [Methylomonas]|uniref:AAA family ATPase n=1 Tax=Methylomonas TaxID=416 RepID=UPI0009EF6DA6|nr:AAA family ATPase [Methylomonas koyamae]
MTAPPSNQGVYFLSLSVENVRCFAKKQTLDLSDGNGTPARWTVILGDNGTGKTTLFEALANFKTIFFQYPSLARHSSSQRSRIDVICVQGKGLSQAESEYIQQKFSRLNDGIEIPISEQPEFEIPQAFYLYTATRKRKKDDVFDIELEASFESSEGLIDAEEWLLQTDYIAKTPSEIQESYKKRLTIIKDTLIALLPDVADIRISTPSEKSPNPRVEFELPDGWLLLSRLSLGYQTMTAWMVDLAAQLFKHYPNSANPIAEPAVVLIDEIDLHLHPKWQRTIMAYLSERFVNTQFIVTAHSPLIVQAAENANIVVLKREGDSVKIHQHPQDVKGWRIDQLLTSDLFDIPSARSPHYENLLTQRRQILSQPHLSSADQERLNELEAQIGDLPTAETRQDMEAMDIIRRAAELLKQSA